MLAHSKTPQILENLSAAQSSSIGSGLGDVAPRPFSHGLLASSTVTTSPTPRELYDLQIELDFQCLQFASQTDIRSAHHAAADVNSIVEIAIYLSGPLCVARYPGTFLYQELQLRALVSCLALLHYHGVEALYPEQWDKLKNTHISREGPFQLQSGSTLWDKIRHAPNVYLGQLASQYLSFIGRGNSNLPEIVGPITRILWGSIAVAGNQYNKIQDILKGLAQLALLWQTPQTKYKALWGLQEYTRLASSLFREALESQSAKSMKEAATFIVLALLEKVDGLLTAETETSSPRLGGQWMKTRRVLGTEGPTLGRGYFFFGILDCAAQLATLADVSALRDGFFDQMRRLCSTSDVPEYRWKAMEILLSFPNTRTEQFRRLKFEIEESPRVSIRDTALVEASTVREILDHDEEASLRFCVSEPPIVPPRTPPIDPDLVTESLPSTDPDVVESDFQEPFIPRSKIKTTSSMSISFPRDRFFSSLLGRTSFNFAGLSSDCQHVFFYDHCRISMFHLNNPKGKPLELGRDFTNGDPILDAAMSQRFLVIATSQRILTFDLVERHQLEVVSFDAWESSGIACFESSNQLVLALGQGQGNSSKASQGQIVVYKYEKSSRLKRLEACSTLPLPTQDRPKRVYLNAVPRILTCVTTIQNRVLVWDLDESFSPVSEPFDFVKNHYRKERYETGITSTSAYISPSDKPYILCTTAPSSERHKHKGEWSFIVPVPRPRVQIRPRLRPPSNVAYNFEQFKDHRALRGGAVSSKHNVFAVLEDNGRISVLPLVAGENGGISEPGKSRNKVTILDKAIGRVGGCLRFTPDGERLVAVDAEGKVVIAEFEKE